MGNIRQKRMMKTNRTSDAVLEAPPKDTQPCAKGHCHYWIIERPKGPISIGVCRFCGSTKEFDNFGPDFRWYGDTPELLVPSLPDLTTDKEK